MICVCELNTKVRGKARPRVAGGRAYTVPADRSAEGEIAWAWRSQCPDMGGYEREVRVTVDYQRACPKSVKAGLPDTGKPDVDNVAKLVMDALTGIAWKDDAQVTSLTIRKHPRFPRRSDYLRVAVDYMEG